VSPARALSLTCALGLAALSMAVAQESRPTAGGAVGPVAAVLGTPFELPQGAVAKIDTERLEIRFVEVLEDSRCPPNVQCVWAGRARIRVSVSQDGNGLGDLELSTLDQAQDKAPKLAGYRFTFVAVAPGPPAAGGPIPDHYVATLRVEKV
jgi:hypothetical protein